MKRSSVLQSLLLSVLTCVGSLAVPESAFAQYFGNNFCDFGVNSGTQSGPGFFVAIPFAPWNADNIKDADGNTLAASRFQGLDIRAMFPTIIGVTPKKLLGANYGFMVAPPFSTIRPERTIPETLEKDWGLNDLYVVPLYLAWHAPRADFVAEYGFYAPTGRYEAGANDNVGLGSGRRKFRLAPRSTSTRRRRSVPRRRRTSSSTRTRRTRI